MKSTVIVFGKSKKPYTKIDSVFKKLRSLSYKRIQDNKLDNVFETMIHGQLSGLETHALMVGTGHIAWDDTKHLLFRFIVSHYGGRFVTIEFPGPASQVKE